MPQDNNNSSSKVTNHFETIKPVAITPHTSSATDPQTSPRKTERTPNKRATAIGLSAAILLALAVIFFLPDLVNDRNVTPPAKTVNESQSNSKPVESPVQKAQLAKERRDAQDILAQLLEKQQLLEDHQVNLWANDPYQQAMERAKQGDDTFRQRDFASARLHYQSSLTSLTELEAQMEAVFTDYLNQGLAALDQEERELAVEKFTLALFISPDNAIAKQGLARASVFPQVKAELFNALSAQQNGDLNDAKNFYQAALALDPDNNTAKTGLQQVLATLSRQKFMNTLSTGYTALEHNDLTKAITSFRQALNIEPDSVEAKQALTLTQNKQARLLLNRRLAQANSYEQAEKWRDAEKIYSQILAADNTVIEARIGEIHTRTRANLDAGLQTFIDNPGRLSSPNVFQQAQQTLAEGRAITPMGSRLSRQVASLQTLLIQAAAPWPVQIISDNKTDVVLFRIGQLGKFDAQTVKLKPGNYVATGSRRGYRDVRVEFQVTGGKALQITVRCQEAI